MIKISRLITALTAIGYDKHSDLLLRLASMSYPDNKKIIDKLWDTFDIDKPKEVRIFRFLSIKNLSLTDSADEASKNEASVAAKQATEFITNNPDIKDELSEAQKLWETWGTWDPLKKTTPPPSTNSNQQRPTPPEETFYEEEFPFKDPEHPDIDGAIPGKTFSDPTIGLSQQSGFYYLSPLDKSGKMMDVDLFFETYIKMGVVPITSGSGGSVFYEMFLNTAEDIYNLDEEWVSEYISMLKMEDSVYGNTTEGGSRFFADEPEDQWGRDTNSQEDEEEYYDQKVNREIKSITSLLGEIKSDKLRLSQQAVGISQDKAATPEAQASSNELKQSIVESTTSVFGMFAVAFGITEGRTNLESSNIYKMIRADLKTYNALFKANKELGLECAKHIAEENPPLFANLRLHKIYDHNDYEFSEKSLERLLDTPEGLDVFYGGEIWRDLPEHFLELAAKQDALKFFASSAFKTGAANQRSIGIASAEYLNIGESALAWLKLDIAGKLPKGHIDAAMRLLAEQSPVHFLSLSTKDGKKFCDFYPRFKGQAIDSMKQESYELANNDPIAFYSKVIPDRDKTWADYFPKTQSILAKKAIAKMLIDDPTNFAVKFIFAGLCRIKELITEAKIAINNVLNDSDVANDYMIERDDLLSGKNLDRIKEMVNDTVESPRDYSYLDNPKETKALFEKIREYLTTV